MKFHPKAIDLIAGKSYKEARKILRGFGCTHSEQDQVIRAAKQAKVFDLSNSSPENKTHG